MKLTAKGRYAVTAMLDLALHQKQGESVPLIDIANRQDLSQSFLEQLFCKLKKSGLVESIRGSKGGYYLSKQDADISVADIIFAIEENIDSTYCKGAKNCKSGSKCITHNLWSRLNSVVNQFLENITLNDLKHKRYPAFELERAIKVDDNEH